MLLYTRKAGCIISVPFANYNIGDGIMNKMKQIRYEKNLSLRGLEKICGISKTHLSRIENGKTDPTLSTMCIIARGLEVNIWDIWSCEEVPDDNNEQGTDEHEDKS